MRTIFCRHEDRGKSGGVTRIEERILGHANNNSYRVPVRGTECVSSMQVERKAVWIF